MPRLGVTLCSSDVAPPPQVRREGSCVCVCVTPLELQFHTFTFTGHREVWHVGYAWRVHFEMLCGRPCCKTASRSLCLLCVCLGLTVLSLWTQGWYFKVIIGARMFGPIQSALNRGINQPHQPKERHQPVNNLLLPKSTAQILPLRISCLSLNCLWRASI